MHIGFITSEFPHVNYRGSIGGIGTFMKNLSVGLIDHKHKVSIFLYNQSEDNQFIYGDLTIYHISRKVIKGLGSITNRRYVQNRVNKIVDTQNIDLLESYDWTGFTAFMKFDIPLVIRLHGSDTFFCDLENRSVKWINKCFEKKTLNHADYLIGVSDFVSKQSKRIFNLKKEIVTIYNGIDTKEFEPYHANIKEGSLLYFGTLVRKKGVIAICKMFNQLVEKNNQATLTFLGRNNRDVITQKSTLDLCLDEMSEKAKSRFTHINSVPYGEVKSYIQKSDVVLLPSYAEAFPMSWLEAMSLEKKLITSDIGWAKELMIHGETGFMINPDNTSEFLKAVQNILKDQEKALEMAKKARRRIIESFSQKEVLTQNINFYQSLINDRI